MSMTAAVRPSTPKAIDLEPPLLSSGVDDGDVVVLDKDQDAGSVVGAADADVVQAAVDAQGDCSCLVT